MKTSIVVTSIASPTPAMRALAEGSSARGLEFFCIGDSASPENFELPGCDFYSLARQRGLSFYLAPIAPAKHYTRKNLGYLLAASRGADTIVETDDDNRPLPDFWAEPRKTVDGRLVEKAGWANAYKYFTGAPIWPRGFPLEGLREPPAPVRDSAAECPIQQGLADGDPDVDAVYRLTGHLPIEFGKGSPVILAPGVWCPFNSQNTIWWREAFPLLYLPSACSFRMTDIWRSFVAQRCAWAAGWRVSFHAATVFQDRNEHNLLKDFEQEVPGYLNNARIARTLGKLDLAPGPENQLANLRACYEALIALGVIGPDERPLLEAWCADISALGL